MKFLDRFGFGLCPALRKDTGIKYVVTNQSGDTNTFFLKPPVNAHELGFGCDVLMYEELGKAGSKADVRAWLLQTAKLTDKVYQYNKYAVKANNGAYKTFVLLNKEAQKGYFQNCQEVRLLETAFHINQPIYSFFEIQPWLSENVDTVPLVSNHVINHIQCCVKPNFSIEEIEKRYVHVSDIFSIENQAYENPLTLDEVAERLLIQNSRTDHELWSDQEKIAFASKHPDNTRLENDIEYKKFCMNRIKRNLELKVIARIRREL